MDFATGKMDKADRQSCIAEGLMMASDDKVDMDYASLEVPWSGDEKAQRMVRLRWGATFVYMVMVIVGAILPFYWPELDEDLFVTIYLVIVIGGAIGLMVILSSPLMRPPDSEVPMKDGLAIEDGVTRRLRPGETYYLRIRFKLILYIMVPVTVMMAVMMLFIPDRTTLIIMGITTAVMAIVTMIFMNFEVRADRSTLSFKFGHFGKTLPLASITSISVTQVNAMKDFMGYGVRIGPDGTIGYILQGDVGFRVETDKGKRYVVTIPEPEALVEYVKAAKTESEQA